MERSVIPHLSESPHEFRREPPAVAVAAWHALAWLAVANLIGVWLALLLLVPGAGAWLAPLSYGRWMPVHLDLQLYGWLSLPLVAWLLRVYQADGPPVAAWSRVALILWSLALSLGSLSWLGGHSSGKLFLDWTGYPRVYFPLAILFLWGVLLWAFLRSRKTHSPLAHAAKLGGLALLLPVPFLIYVAADVAIYPPVNPSSGGPTGASQLESVLIIVLILFVLPYGLAERRHADRRWIRVSWIVFAVEALLCLGLGLGRNDVSNHRLTQFLSLGSLLVWVPLLPAYWSGFVWDKRTRIWRAAVLFWWALLIPTGWSLFLPGILDRFKFTDGLVGHSLLAMAGFVTSLLLLLLIVLLGEDGEALDARWAFWVWNSATLLYILVMFYAGWIEGRDPAFTILPGTLRTALYIVRLLCGIAMFAASLNWLVRLNSRIQSQARAPYSTADANPAPMLETSQV